MSNRRDAVELDLQIMASVRELSDEVFARWAAHGAEMMAGIVTGINRTWRPMRRWALDRGFIPDDGPHGYRQTSRGRVRRLTPMLRAEQTALRRESGRR